jgi:DNA-binding NtrC family response regulator
MNSPGTPWILVVDDDNTMLGLMELVLKMEGLTVQVATSAKAATALVDASPTPPAVLVCDVIMEGMDGLELTRRLLARIPNLKAIIASAHLADVAWWPEDLRGHPFLAKPFKNEQLVAAVRTALGS